MTLKVWCEYLAVMVCCFLWTIFCESMIDDDDDAPGGTPA